MFIVTNNWTCGSGDSVEEAILDFENKVGGYFDSDTCAIYEAKEIKVQRKFEVIKED